GGDHLPGDVRGDAGAVHRDHLEDELGARLGEVEAPPGADPGAELEVLVGQQVALVIEVGQAVDIRALEGAGDLLDQAVSLDEEGTGLGPGNDGEAVDVEGGAAAGEAEDAGSSAG